MLRISLAAFALLALLAWTAPVLAADPVPPSNPVDAPTYTLELDDQDDDTDLVHYYRRYGFRRSYFGGGFRYSYYRPYYSYYRPYYGYGYSSYYYPRYSYSYYQPYYNSYFAPSYYGGYYGGGYYNGGFYNGGYYGGFYGGGCGYISGDYDTVVAAVPLGDLPCIPVLPVLVVPQQSNSNSTQAPQATNRKDGSPVMPRVPVDEGKQSESYRYDGGPQNSVPPNQKTQPSPQSSPSVVPPKQTVPATGYLVSLPEQPANGSGSLSYRAYGSVFAAPEANAPPARTSGFAYRAYGEQTQPSGFAAGR